MFKHTWLFFLLQAKRGRLKEIIARKLSPPVKESEESQNHSTRRRIRSQFVSSSGINVMFLRAVKYAWGKQTCCYCVFSDIQNIKNI